MNQTLNRVVITGMGAITPLGLSVEEMWQGLLAGKSGIGPVSRFDSSELRTHIAAEVRNFDPNNYMDRKETRRLDLRRWWLVANRPARRWWPGSDVHVPARWSCWRVVGAKRPAAKSCGD